MPVSETLYQQVALADPEGTWELVCGRLREKPAMAVEHNRLARRLVLQIGDQMDRRRYEVASNSARLRLINGNHYVPDLVVLPVALIERLAAHPGSYEVYSDPVPLVVEIWSPSTGGYDSETKIPEYQRCSDLEVWRIHPYEHTLTAWLRQPDGSYQETQYESGPVPAVALVGVTIDLDALFGD